MAILEQIRVDGNAVGMGTAGGRQGPSFWFPLLSLPSSSLQSLLAFTLPYPPAFAAKGRAQGWQSSGVAEQGRHCGNHAHFEDSGGELLYWIALGEKGVEQVEPLLRGWVEH